MKPAAGTRRSVPLSWHEAIQADRETLKHFTCADPPQATWDKYRHQKHHPRQWELDVQSYFRQVKVPVRRPDGLEYMYLLKNRDEVLSAAHFGYDTAEEQFIIYAIARSTSLAGSGMGAVTLGMTLAFLRAVKGHGEFDCAVFARIHPKNEPSKKMFGNAGFEPVGIFEELEMWVHELN